MLKNILRGVAQHQIGLKDLADKTTFEILSGPMKKNVNGFPAPGPEHNVLRLQ